MVQLGSQALFELRERIVKTGIDAQGAKYMPYSTKAMLVGCKSMNVNVCNSFFGKEKNRNYKWVTLDKVNSQGKKIRLATLEGGYKKLRELHGRQTSFVDFMFSGKMWGNIKIISNNSEHIQGTVRIGATTEEDNKKLEGNTKRRTDILKLSQREIADLVKSYSMNIQQIINKQGLA
jgi:hypothetical protein